MGSSWEAGRKKILGLASKDSTVGAENQILVIGVSTRSGETQILVGEDAIWVPRKRSYGARDAPGLLEMLLDSSLAHRHVQASTERLTDIQFNSAVGSELQRALPRVARPVPFTSIVNCWLSKGRWIVKPSFGFRFFDQRKRALGSMSFTIASRDVAKLARRLSETIPDRFETDWVDGDSC